MNIKPSVRTAGVLSILGLAACNGSGEFLRSMLAPNNGIQGFAKGKVGPDGTPVQRTGYGQAPAAVQAGETYQKHAENPWVETAGETTSTFGVDVDNGSYTLMRDDIRAGRLPHPDGVRPEEYINFFDYDYEPPTGNDAFSVNMELGPSPFGDAAQMLKIGLQAGHIDASNMRPTNLVFLIDTSGSMGQKRKLPMVKESLNTLLDHLRPTDTVGIVTYAGKAGVLLPPTPVRQAKQIRSAIDRLSAGGSTYGEGGIVAAYRLAEQGRIEGGNNRVVLATDGDFNVGRTGEELLELIREYRKKHILITTVGYGRGNFNDAIMEGIAREGNGNYFYVDDAKEARRIFGRNLASTLQVVATDVKVQVEFDPSIVHRYRLVGYDNRVMANREFADDAKDAGDIGQGHSVTALYEIELVGSCSEAPLEEHPGEEVPVEEGPVIDEEPAETEGPWEETDVEPAGDCRDVILKGSLPGTPLATVRLRHKAEIGLPSQLQQTFIYQEDLRRDLAETTPGFQFAVAVAHYAETLRASGQSGRGRFDEILGIASAASGSDATKLEFIDLARRAAPLYRER